MMKALLRSSILYACETYYDLKESEVRQLERIEEGFLRELLKTGRGCPITQLYLEVGLIPARYEIIKIRLLFLKYILDQNTNSKIFKFFELQLENSGRGDWTTMCMDNLRELKIKESLQEIKQMSYMAFKNILKKCIQEEALRYLTEKQGSKGKEIKYSEIQMAEYLSPLGSDLSNVEKCEIFEIRNKMKRNIPANFSSRNIEHKCICGSQENMKHIYFCKKLNSEEPTLEYENIYSNNTEKVKIVYERFLENDKKREEIIADMKKDQNVETKNGQTNLPMRSSCDPLYSG